MSASSFRAKLQQLQQIDRLSGAEKNFAETELERRTLVSASVSQWEPVCAKQENLHVFYNGLLVRKCAVDSLASDRRKEKGSGSSSTFVGRFRALPKTVTVASSKSVADAPVSTSSCCLPLRAPMLSLAECRRELEELSDLPQTKTPLPSAIAPRPVQTPKTRPSTALHNVVSRPTSSSREIPTRPCSAKSANILSTLQPLDHIIPRKRATSEMKASLEDGQAVLLRKRNDQRSSLEHLKAQLARLENGEDLDSEKPPEPRGKELVEQAAHLEGAETVLESEWTKHIDSTFPLVPGSDHFPNSSNIVSAFLGPTEQCLRDLTELHQQFAEECRTIRQLQLNRKQVQEISAAVVQRFFFKRVYYPKRQARDRFVKACSELAAKEERAAILIQRFFRWYQWKISLSHGNDDVEYV